MDVGLSSVGGLRVARQRQAQPFADVAVADPLGLGETFGVESHLNPLAARASVSGRLARRRRGNAEPRARVVAGDFTPLGRDALGFPPTFDDGIGNAR